MHMGFKPYYNWNTFNTQKEMANSRNRAYHVLNLVKSGIPSIRHNEKLYIHGK